MCNRDFKDRLTRSLEKEENELSLYYPDTYTLDCGYKVMFHQCNPILPNIDDRVIKEVVPLNGDTLSPMEKKLSSTSGIIIWKSGKVLSV